jgi:hypothetical protein
MHSPFAPQDSPTTPTFHQGCGTSTDKDGTVYQDAAEVTVFEANGSGGAGSDAGDGGKAEVAKAITTILASRTTAQFDQTIADMQANGGVPPPGSELALIAAEEGCNGVGALFTIARSLEQQIDERSARSRNEDVARKVTAELRAQLASTQTLLAAAVDHYVNEWQLEVPGKALRMGDPALFAKLWIANRPGEVTQQQVLGALVLQAERRQPGNSKILQSGAEVWDHGEITEEAATQRVLDANTVDARGNDHGRGSFLISTRPQGFAGKDGATGEYWLTVFLDAVGHYPIKIDPQTKMLLISKDCKPPG